MTDLFSEMSGILLLKVAVGGRTLRGATMLIDKVGLISSHNVSNCFTAHVKLFYAETIWPTND